VRDDPTHGMRLRIGRCLLTHERGRVRGSATAQTPSPPAATADGVLTRACSRLPNPVSRRDAAEGGTRMRPTRLWGYMYAHVHVP
jgi:hypothetical protein